MKNAFEEGKLLTAAQAAKLAGVDVTYIKRMWRNNRGGLVAFQVPSGRTGDVVFSLESVEQFIAEKDNRKVGRPKKDSE